MNTAAVLGVDNVELDADKNVGTPYEKAFHSLLFEVVCFAADYVHNKGISKACHVTTSSNPLQMRCEGGGEYGRGKEANIGKRFLILRCDFLNHHRQHDWKGSTPHTLKEDHGTVLNSLDLQTLSLARAEGGDITGADSSALRKSMLAGNVDIEVEKPLQSVSERPNSRLSARVAGVCPRRKNTSLACRSLGSAGCFGNRTLASRCMYRVMAASNYLHGFTTFAPRVRSRWWFEHDILRWSVPSAAGWTLDVYIPKKYLRQAGPAMGGRVPNAWMLLVVIRHLLAFFPFSLFPPELVL